MTEVFSSDLIEYFDEILGNLPETFSFVLNQVLQNTVYIFCKTEVDFNENRTKALGHLKDFFNQIKKNMKRQSKAFALRIAVIMILLEVEQGQLINKNHFYLIHREFCTTNKLNNSEYQKLKKMSYDWILPFRK